MPLGRHPGLIFRICFSCCRVMSWVDQLVLMSLWVFWQKSTCAFIAPSNDPLTILLLKSMSLVRRRTGKADMDNSTQSFSFFLQVVKNFLFFFSVWGLEAAIIPPLLSPPNVVFVHITKLIFFKCSFASPGNRSLKRECRWISYLTCYHLQCPVLLLISARLDERADFEHWLVSSHLCL